MPGYDDGTTIYGRVVDEVAVVVVVDDDDGLEILATAQSTSMGVTHASNIILK